MFEVKNLSFQYPSSEKIFFNFSFELPAHGLFHLAGPNGRGKTTLLKIISQLIVLKEGEITFNGKRLESSAVSYMPSQPESSFHQLTGKETLDLFCRLNKEAELPESVLNHLGTLENFQKALETKFAFCSTGMKQIINLGRAFSKRTPILLLDEPLHGLDTETKKHLADLFTEVKKDHLILITSHDQLNLPIDQSFTLEKGGLKDA